MALAAVLAALPAQARAQDDAPKAAGIRTAVAIPKVTPCNSSPITVKELGDAFYTLPEQEFADKLSSVLFNCSALSSDGYFVIVFTARPTEGAEDPSVIHVLLHKQGEAARTIRGFPGISRATWVYLTDESSDVLRMELVSTAAEHPLIGQLGALAGAVLEGLKSTIGPEKLTVKSVGQPRGSTKTIYFGRIENVGLPFKRGSITETLYIQRTVKETDPKTKDVTDKKVQYDAKTSFENVPPAWLTLHAGVGVLSGKLHGATPAKVEDEAYASEPLKRAATLAGVSFHVPFDSTAPTPGWQERLGFVTAAVITPAVGIYIGPSFGWRSFSFTAGPAWMWTPSPPPDLKIGDPVKKPEAGSDEQQLVFGKVRAWLIGGAYAFGK